MTASFCALAAGAHGEGPKPPGPPAEGPGSAVYGHTGVAAELVRSGARGWWLFTPTGPAPSSAPVVIFCHGWGATEPAVYRAWIDHIVRRGAIVVYPLYQAGLATPTADFLPNAEAAVREALTYIGAGKAGTAPAAGKLAAVGHSAGGLVAASLAADARSAGLPRFGAVLAVEPGNSWEPQRLAVPLADMSRLPADTLLLVMVGADDRLAGARDGRRIRDEATAVPSAGKTLLEMRSDSHGEPALLANHLAPTAALRAGDGSRLHARWVDAMDWYGTW